MKTIQTRRLRAGLLALVTGGCAATGASTAVPPEVPPGDRQAVVAGNTAFALDLYEALGEREGNVLVAPHGVSVALAMTYAGARAETAGQMARTLHLDLPPQRLHAAFGAIGDRLGPVGAGRATGAVELATANALWGRDDRVYREPFLTTIRDHYGAGFERLDLRDPEAARAAVNDRIAAGTNGRIEELLHASDLSGATEMVLTNAVFFRGAWLHPFDERYSRPGEFFLDDEASVTTPFMGVTASFPCFAGDGITAVELPYDGERLAMVLVVPQRRHGLADVEAGLTPARLGRWLEELEEQAVHVHMPRIALGSRHHLARPLAAMGMPDAFAPGRADFSGICGAPGTLWIDRVIHQTFIELDERGTEAVAGTAVVLKRGGGRVVRADHPFLFLIRDRETGVILFLGRVADPTAG
jgi:serpin B